MHIESLKNNNIIKNSINHSYTGVSSHYDCHYYDRKLNLLLHTTDLVLDKVLKEYKTKDIPSKEIIDTLPSISEDLHRHIFMLTNKFNQKLEQPWSYMQSTKPSLVLFIEALLSLRERVYMKKIKYSDFMCHENDDGLLDFIKKERKKEHSYFSRKKRKNKASMSSLISDIFANHSKVLVIRLDLGFNQEEKEKFNIDLIKQKRLDFYTNLQKNTKSLY